MDFQDEPGLPRPCFGRRLLVVGCTWLLLAGVARWLSPALAVALGVLPLGAAGRAVWLARRRTAWEAPDGRGRRQAMSGAVLIAAGLLTATVWSLRAVVPLWLVMLQVGALLQYWLLGLAES